MEAAASADAAFRLDGRIALVTGASRGIGWSIAGALADSGAHVVLTSRNGGALAERVAAIADRGGRAEAVVLDVTDTAAGAAAVEQVARAHGRLDVLVNNAGIIRRSPLAEMTDADWQDVIATDLTACFVLGRAAGRVMALRGQGRILMISSILGSIARPQVAGYVTAKGGLNALTRALAIELGPAGITCNAIAPGYTRTEQTQPLQDDAEFDALVRRRTPLGRWAEPEEIARVAVFLASEAASYINGAVLTVDGGLTAAL